MSYLLEVIGVDEVAIIVIEEEIRDTIAGRLKIIVVAVVQAVMLAELLLPANRGERSVTKCPKFLTIITDN